MRTRQLLGGACLFIMGPKLVVKAESFNTHHYLGPTTRNS